jgi:hypothetical protein
MIGLQTEIVSGREYLRNERLSCHGVVNESLILLQHNRA